MSRELFRVVKLKNVLPTRPCYNVMHIPCVASG